MCVCVCVVCVRLFVLDLPHPAAFKRHFSSMSLLFKRIKVCVSVYMSLCVSECLANAILRASN